MEMKNNKYEKDRISEEEISQSFVHNNNNNDVIGEKKYVVLFMNLQSGMYLKINDEGRLDVVNSEKDFGTRLVVRTMKGSGNNYGG